jgi:hypothetical protein
MRFYLFSLILLTLFERTSLHWRLTFLIFDAYRNIVIFVFIIIRILSLLRLVLRLSKIIFRIILIHLRLFGLIARIIIDVLSGRFFLYLIT